MVGYVKDGYDLNYNNNTTPITTKQYNNNAIEISSPHNNGGITSDIRERAIGSRRFFGFRVFCGFLLLLSQRQLVTVVPS